jgi:hypothetical protein
MSHRHYSESSYQLIASTANEHLSIVVLDLLVASRSTINIRNNSSISTFAFDQRRSMFCSLALVNEIILSDSSALSKLIIQLIRYLKALFETELHKRRIKSSHREIYEIICYFYSKTNSNLSSVAKSSSKKKIRATRSLKNSSESFFFEWVVNFFLIISVVKSLIKQIENFKRSLFFKAFQYKNRNISFIDNTLRETTSNQIEFQINQSDRQKLQKKIEDKIVEFSNLFESKYIDSRTKKTLDFDFNEFDISQTSLLDDRLTQQTFLRVQSSDQISRVQSEIYFVQFSHLTNLRELFIAKLVSSLSIISAESFITLTAETVFSEKYSVNASSTEIRQFNYQSLQSLVQRNFDFLTSILSRSQFRLITSQFVESAKNPSVTIEFQSNQFNFESNQKRRSHHDIAIVRNEKKYFFIVFLTTSRQNQRQFSSKNSFLSSSVSSFDFLFHQFRSSFSSNFFISSAKSVFSSKLSADFHFDTRSLRIEKLKESIQQEYYRFSNIDTTDNFFSEFSRFTNIISVMSNFEENIQRQLFTLSQQNIQRIVLFMFNLFAQNVQSQLQAKTIETTANVVTAAKKSSFRTSNVRFFDSQLNFSYESDNVVQVNRDLYYRDVYFFVKRVKNVMIMSDAEVVRINLSICLRETTQVWYTEDLSHLKKEALRTLDEDADHWCNALLKKFKKFVTSVLNYLIIERYILNDVRANRDIFNFVFQIMRHVKIANITDLHEQLTWTYNVIAFELFKNIDSFDENISIMTFLKNLKTKKNTWHRIYTRKSTSSRIESEFQTNFSNSLFLIHEQSTYSSRQYSQRQFQ